MVDRKVMGAFAGGLVLAGAAAGGYVVMGHQSYEECMVDAMRGQERVMYGAADKVCSRKTGRVQDVTYSKGMLDFRNQWDGTVLIKAASDQYDIVQGTFSVASKDCDKVVEADWAPEVMADAKTPNSLVLHLTDGQKTASALDTLCFRTLGLKGR